MCAHNLNIETGRYYNIERKEDYVFIVIQVPLKTNIICFEECCHDEEK